MGWPLKRHLTNGLWTSFHLVEYTFDGFCHFLKLIAVPKRGTSVTTLGKRLINIDLYTDAYRVSGTVLARSNGLIAELENTGSDFLELESAFISRIYEPGKILGSYSSSPLRKENICFVILQDRRDGISVSSSQTKSLFDQERLQQAFLTVPSFEIYGGVTGSQGGTPTSLLVNSPGRFQLLYDAQACAAQNPEIIYNGDLILVRKDRIGFFSVFSHRNGVHA